MLFALVAKIIKHLLAIAVLDRLAVSAMANGAFLVAKASWVAILTGDRLQLRVGEFDVIFFGQREYLLLGFARLDLGDLLFA